MTEATDNLSEICNNISGMYDYLSKNDNLIALLKELPQKYPYSYEAIDTTYKKQIDEAIKNAPKKATSVAEMQQTFQQIQPLYDNTLVMINDLRDEHFDFDSSVRFCNFVSHNRGKSIPRSKTQSMVTDIDQIIYTNNNAFLYYMGLNPNLRGPLHKGDYVDIKLGNNLDNSCLMLYGFPGYSDTLRINVCFKDSINNKWECVKKWIATNSDLPIHGKACVIDLNKVSKDIDRRYIRLECVNEKEISFITYITLSRRDDFMDDDDYLKLDSIEPILNSQYEKGDVQRSLTKEIEDLTSNFIDDDQGSATFVDFRGQEYTPYMPNEDILISDVANAAYVICEADEQVYRRTVTADNGAYLVKGSPVILHGTIGSCINILRKSGGIFGQPVDTTDNILKISKESDCVNGGYVFRKGKFNHTDYQVFEEKGIAYFKFDNANLGENFNIEELKEGRPEISSVSNITDNHTELRVYDLSGRYIPVKELNKLPSGIYIVNGKKVIVK